MTTHLVNLAVCSSSKDAEGRCKRSSDRAVFSWGSWSRVSGRAANACGIAAVQDPCQKNVLALGRVDETAGATAQLEDNCLLA